ncbi:MAG: hypothetical protein K1Y36_13485 [Blastocatellia bacterium]|nr:hypothetical protein [Blastocatellia bacterium]
MFLRILKFLRLPMTMIAIFTIARYFIGLAGVPYAPRGNAMFSIVGLTLVSAIYFGAMSGKVGGLSRLSPVLIGLTLAFWSQILIFLATWLSYATGHEAVSYFTHWDSLNFKVPTPAPPMVDALKLRLGGFVVFPVICTVAAYLGRGLGLLLVDEPKSGK